MKGSDLIFLFILFALGNSLFSQEIKDKTKYYVKDIENFNNYSSNGWDLLDEKQLKVIAKALNINTEEAQKIITGTRYYNHPKNKKNTDVSYIMYKICELNGYKNGGFKYIDADDILCLLYVPNDLNTHLPSDKLAENGKGFYQITRKESISTTPLSAEYYKPAITLKDENYSFGFIFGAKNNDSLVILKVIKSSPAEKAGFIPNDIITEFNGQDIKNKTRIDAMKIFKESAFTNNTFKILRNNSLLTITADKVNARTLEFVCISQNCDNGECIIEHINGYTIKGNCKDGNIIGNAKFTTEDGFEFYEGQVKKLSSTFNNYKYVSHGFGKEKFRNGNTFEGNYVNGEKDGTGILTYANGTQKKGIWKEGKYFDEISIGFANERFRVTAERIYLHHPKNNFKSKMAEVSDEEKKKVMIKYKLSEEDINKLFALCDMKYKPAHLNTPEKIRTIIDKNQKDYPYEAYFVAQIYGTDNEIYYIIYLPTAYNRWLPQGVTFDVPDGLYFCIPASEANFGDYYSYEQKLAILKGVEEQKIREQEQQKLSAEKAEWSAKNKFKGVFMIQYEGNTTNYSTTDDELIRVVSVFAPINQIFTEADRIILEKKYESSAWKLKTSNFFENMDEAQAIKYLTDEKGYDRFSINTNYSYTIPERQTQTYTNKPTKKELQDNLDAALKERDKALDAIINDKPTQKTTSTSTDNWIEEDFEVTDQQKSSLSNLTVKNKNHIPKGTKVLVTGLWEKEDNYNNKTKYIGQTGTAEYEILENNTGLYNCAIRFDGEEKPVVFYGVKLKIAK